LPFIEAHYAPEAFPTELVPPGLKDEREATTFLKEHLNRMPAPVVRMTPSCVAAPWLVTLLAHEVGHHLQFDLLPERRLVAKFRKLLESAVSKETGSADEARKWGAWSSEIFADVFSVIAMGPWAVWAMAELEFKSAKYLNEERDAYPSPAMRLALLAEACDRVTGTGSGSSALRNLFQVEASTTRRAVLDSALGVLPGLGTTLAGFCAADLPAFAWDVAQWQSFLEKKDERDPEPKIENAPVLTAAALATYILQLPVGLNDGRRDEVCREKASLLRAFAAQLQVASNEIVITLPGLRFPEGGMLLESIARGIASPTYDPPASIFEAVKNARAQLFQTLPHHETEAGFDICYFG
jgi:hypothetical protein